MFKAVLSSLLDNKNFSVQGLADYVGVSNKSVYDWVNGKFLPNRKHHAKIAEYFDLSEREFRALLEPEEPATGWVVVPLLGSVPAGNPIEATECHESNFSLPAHIARRVDFGLRVKGESMINAGILPGDIVFVKYQPVAENRQIVVAKIDGEATIKRYFKADHTVVLRPENSAMELTLVTPDRTFQIVGIVTGLWRPEIK